MIKNRNLMIIIALCLVMTAMLTLTVFATGNNHHQEEKIHCKKNKSHKKLLETKDLAEAREQVLIMGRHKLDKLVSKDKITRSEANVRYERLKVEVRKWDGKEDFNFWSIVKDKKDYKRAD